MILSKCINGVEDTIVTCLINQVLETGNHDKEVLVEFSDFIALRNALGRTIRFDNGNIIYPGVLDYVTVKYKKPEQK